MDGEDRQVGAAVNTLGRADRAVNAASEGGGCAGRMSARSVLLENASWHRQKAARLEALARSIPENFPLDADEALWNLAIESRR